MMVNAYPRDGATLVELLITLAIIALMAVTAGLAIRSPSARTSSTPATRISEARRGATSHGRPVTVEIVVDGRVQSATAFPDGTVIADSLLMIYPLTGRSAHAGH